jgi:ABC-type sulfate/molybdate transport systems ATPase subunit
MSSRIKLEALEILRPGFLIRADLEVRAGEQVLLMGPSGSGKSSIVRVMLGLEAQASGNVWIGEQDVSAEPARARGVGAMLQGADFLEELSAIDNVALALKLRGESWKAARMKAVPWLDRFGLGGRAQASIDTLSGGERSRLAWARVYVAQHRALVFDEPLTGVDLRWTAEFRSALTETVERRQIPALICTHEADGWAACKRAFKLVQSDLRTLHEFTL